MSGTITHDDVDFWPSNGGKWACNVTSPTRQDLRPVGFTIQAPLEKWERRRKFLVAFGVKRPRVGEWYVVAGMVDYCGHLSNVMVGKAVRK